MLPSVHPTITTATTTAEPSAIDPSTTYNVIGIQFTDPTCKDPTGVEEIVSGETFENCYSIYFGGPKYVSACPRQGLFVTQQFAAADTTCTGEVIFVFVFVKMAVLFLVFF